MDHGVHVGKARIEHGAAAHHAVAFGDGVEATERLGAFQEFVLVGHGQGRAAQGDRAVDERHVRVHHAAFGVDARAVGSARPTADDDVLVAAGFAHELAQLQAAVVVGDDVDDLAVFQMRNELFEEGLVRDGRHAHDDELGALHRFGDAIGDQAERGLAEALEAVLRLRWSDGIISQITESRLSGRLSVV